ncbi:MAG: hypothetical protein D6820_05020 [Lentisphaerae bacterium]|nr:MAG: hypothetical protein D6820_05020 [Lentisphaerota bacterium]
MRPVECHKTEYLAVFFDNTRDSVFVRFMKHPAGVADDRDTIFMKEVAQKKKELVFVTSSFCKWWSISDSNR